MQRELLIARLDWIWCWSFVDRYRPQPVSKVKQGWLMVGKQGEEEEYGVVNCEL